MAETPAVRRLATSEALPVEALTTAVRSAVCGPANVGSGTVIWSDRGSQILLHVDTLKVRTAKATVVVAVDTESAEFGVAPLIVRFVFGDGSGPASLVASSDPTALGHPQVAARWGNLFRDVVWAAIARLVDAQASRTGRRPGSITVGQDGLRLAAQPAFSLADLAAEHVRTLVADGVRIAGPPGGARP